MAFKYLNKCAVKLRTAEEIKEAFDDYCKHLAQGLPREAWVFRKDGKPLCTYRTIENYIEEFADVLPLIHVAAAESERYKVWFEVVSQSAKGKSKANPASLQMTMRNLFGWDTRDRETEDTQKKATAFEQFKTLFSDVLSKRLPESKEDGESHKHSEE